MGRTKSKPSEWTTFGRDLLLSLEHVALGQRMTHVVTEIRTAIRSGGLRAGVRLPSTRSLANDLGVSRGLVVGAYELLRAEGYLESTRGSGTRVAQQSNPAPPATAPPPTPLTPLKYSPGVPDPALFPRSAWLKAYRAGLLKLSHAELSYGDPQGYAPLRRELADYLGRVRGIVAHPQNILIVNGFAQAVAIVARALFQRGFKTAAIEDPGPVGIRTQLQAWSLKVRSVAVDGEGLCVPRLERSGAEIVLATPAHQQPTGVVLSPERRHQLIDWVHAGDRYIIEDDYDAEFRYDHAPVGSLQPLASEQVITGSSVSKTLSPALRLGWMVLPPQLVAAAVDAKLQMDLATPTPPQAAFTEFLTTGAFEQHLRRSRRHYRQRRHELTAALSEFIDPQTLSGTEAGLNICMRLPDHCDDEAIATRLCQTGAHCRALSQYCGRRGVQRGLVLELISTQSRHIAMLSQLATHDFKIMDS